MTKDILLKIQGMHFGEQMAEEKVVEEEEPIEVITAGNYYNKNGKHYIKYEEIMEGEKENTSSLIKIQGDTLEVTKKRAEQCPHDFSEKQKEHVLLQHALWKSAGWDRGIPGGSQRGEGLHTGGCGL